MNLSPLKYRITILRSPYGGGLLSKKCNIAFLSLCCRTNTSVLLHWIKTPPCYWLYWASGTSTSSTLRHTLCCPTTSICTVLLHTSNRSVSWIYQRQFLMFLLNLMYLFWTVKRNIKREDELQQL